MPLKKNTKNTNKVRRGKEIKTKGKNGIFCDDAGARFNPLDINCILQSKWLFCSFQTFKSQKRKSERDRNKYTYIKH
jgi:hypothetical protein